jgi:hypothetical protein
MNDFRSANKKAAKSNSSSQALTQQQQQTHHSDQQVRVHQDVNDVFYFLFLSHLIIKTLFFCFV